MNKKKRSERRSMADVINESLDIPPDILSGGTLVEIRAESEVFVTGAKKILLYSKEHIRLATKKGALSVRGERLVCTSYHPNGVRIDGRISSVSFEGVENEEL